MSDIKCPFHYDHENRIKRLEDNKVNPGVWLGIFSFLGVIFTVLGNLAGQIISAYFK